MAAVLCLSVLVSITMGMQLARAQTCGTFAEAGENENSDGGLTIRTSRGTWGACTACPAGQVGANPEDDCQACGVYLDPDSGPAFRGAWGACTGCPKGSYAATITDDCKNCGDYDNPASNPPDSTTQFAGATSASQCVCSPGSMYVPTEEVCGECNGGAGQPPCP